MNPRLVPPTRAQLEALVEPEDGFASGFDMTIAEGWASSPDIVEHILATTMSSPTEPARWFLIVDGEHLVGLAGFKRPPSPESVEIAYAVAPARRNRGIATRAVAELVERARNAGLRRVVAHTLPTENASTRVLSRSGFVRVGVVVDPDGELPGGVWRWVRDLGAATPTCSNYADHVAGVPIYRVRAHLAGVFGSGLAQHESGRSRSELRRRAERGGQA